MTEPPMSAADPIAWTDRKPEDLLRALVDAEDRAPRALAEACVAQGDAMVALLRDAIASERAWSGESRGEWWLLLHAGLLLGRIPSDAAGSGLVGLMHSLEANDDGTLQDWLAGDWPALFANKPPPAVEGARRIASDPALDWYMRCQAVDVVLDAGWREGGGKLEAEIDWAAALAEGDEEDSLFRAICATTLLGFPRERHRRLLYDLAAEERRRNAGTGFVGAFTREDVDSAFAAGADQPDWERRGDPWRFYDDAAIALRQERWRKEDADAEGEHDDAIDDGSLDEDAYFPPTYVRVTAKVGRNDPCPCGSGKKYKRCCFVHDQELERDARALL